MSMQNASSPSDQDKDQGNEKKETSSSSFSSSPSSSISSDTNPIDSTSSDNRAMEQEPHPQEVESKTFEYDGGKFRFFLDETGHGWICASDVCHYIGLWNIRDELSECGALDDARQFLLADTGEKLLWLTEKGLRKLLENSFSKQAQSLLLAIYAQKVPVPIEYFSPGHSNADTASWLNPEAEEDETSQSSEPSENPGLESAKEGTQTSEGFKPDHQEDARLLYRNASTEKPFSEWFKQWVRTLGLKEGADFSWNQATNEISLTDTARDKIIEVLMSQSKAKNTVSEDPDVHLVILEEFPFRYIFDQHHSQWTFEDDIAFYLGADNLELFLNRLGPRAAPEKIATRKSTYLCFNGPALALILPNSEKENISEIYEGLLGKKMESSSLPQETMPDLFNEEQEVEDEEDKEIEGKEEKEEDIETGSESSFANSPNAQPSNSKPSETDSALKKETESSHITEIEATMEEDQNNEVDKTEPSTVLSIEEAISPRIGVIDGKSVYLINGKELYDFLQPPEKSYSDWIEDLINFYEYVENADFIGNVGEEDFNLTLPMAQDIVMTVRNLKGKEARQYLADLALLDIEDDEDEDKGDEDEDEDEIEDEESEDIEDIEGEPEDAIDDENEEYEEEPDESLEEEAQNLAYAAEELRVGYMFLCNYMEQIGWLIPGTTEPKIWTIRDGYMEYDFEESDTDWTPGLLTPQGLRVIRKKLDALGIISGVW